MSDGPHRSLPMRQHWKHVAERAATPAYGPEEIAEAFPIALKKDFREAPVSTIRDILGAGEQNPLFNDNRAKQLEAVRRVCRGSTAGNTLIDCAIEATENGLTGEAALRSALEGALDAHARSGCHQIEEHYRREEPRSTADVRDRLAAARNLCPRSELASELIAGKNDGGDGLRLEKRTGIDEGPSL